MPASTYGLLEFYNGIQEERGIGEAYDLKIVHVMLKGFYGMQKMSEMEEVDFDDPILLFLQNVSFFCCGQLSKKKKIINKQITKMFTL